MSGHPVLDLGARVRVMADTQAWNLDFDSLDVDTFLGGNEETGAWTDLSDDLIEVTWTAGAAADDNPEDVLPLPESGTCELTVWDPQLVYQPPPDTLFTGIRPGRAVQLYDRADGLILWTGIIEQVGVDWSNPSPLTRLTAVQPITFLAQQGGLPADARPEEPVYDRFVWLMNLYLPGVPVRADPAQLTALVSGTEAGQTPWQAFTDCARAQPGWLRVDRDGGIGLRSVDSESLPDWDGHWNYRPNDDPVPARGIRVWDGAGTFTTQLHLTPVDGTAPTGPPEMGTRLLVNTADGYISGTVTDADIAADVLTITCDTDAGGGSWTPPTVNTRTRAALYPARTGGTETPVWAQPDCAPVTLIAGGSDLQRLRNVWRLRRRFDDEGPVFTGEHTQSIAASGRYVTENLSYPSGSDADAARIAALGAQIWGEGRPSAGSLAINVTAAAHTPALPVILQLLRHVPVSAAISVHLPTGGRRIGARVLGWDWTWTAAGALTGRVALTRGLGSEQTGWQLGVYLNSDLGVSTVLA